MLFVLKVTPSLLAPLYGGWLACAQVKDKFCLEFSEEEAVQHIQALIDESVTAVMAVFVERIHKWAQYWRK